MPSISVVIVAFDSAEPLAATVAALQRELQAGDELIVVDNASREPLGDLDGARLIRNEANRGFPAACNQGAAAATGDVLVFLNPDAVPQPGWGEAIRAPRDWVAWQALVTQGADVVNTAGNEVHYTGVAWAGEAGRPLAPRHLERREVATLSGACLAVRAEAFRAVGGFAADFVLYQEDLDLSLRLRLAGGRLGIEPAARAEHDYEFEKGAYKWRLLERNRGAVLVRCWPGRLLWPLLPALAATELAIWAAALAGGWAPEKARATREALLWLPQLARERRSVQAAATIGAAEFARWLTPELSSDFLGRAAESALLNRVLRAYWWLVHPRAR